MHQPTTSRNEFMTSTQPWPTWPSSPRGVGIGMALIFGALIIIGLTGNAMVCVAIYANKKLRKKENLYFVSLAIADLFLCILVMPFAAYNDIAGYWPLGEYCKIWMSLDIMCCTCSIMHLCAISFDRCYHIHFPMQYGQRMTGRKILSAIFLVWALSATIAFAPLAFETHFDQALSVYALIWSVNSSTTIWPNNLLEKRWQIPPASMYYRCSFNLEASYAVVSSLVSFYLPSCVMIVAYAKLYKYARRHVRTIRNQLQTATTLLMNVANTSSIGQKWTGDNQCQQMTSAKKRELGASDSKARITLGVILGLFIFSWGPFFVCNIVRSFCACVPHPLFVALTWMGYANSAQNPIIYSIFNRDFRRAFGKILMCGKSRRKRPSIAVNDHFLIISNRHRNTNNNERCYDYKKYVGRRLSRLSGSADNS